MQDNNVSDFINNKLNNQLKNYSHGRSWTLFIVIALMIIAIATLFSFSYYNYVSNNKINVLLEKNTDQLAVFDNNLKQLQAGVTQDHNTIKEQKTSLDNLLAIEKQPLLHILLLTIKSFITTANLKLKVDNNIESAIMILKIAGNTLLNSNHIVRTEVSRLRQDILVKIENLSQVKSVDLLVTIRLLDDYSTKIDNLKLTDFLSDLNVAKAAKAAKVDVEKDQNNNDNSYDLKQYKLGLIKLGKDFIDFMSGLIKIRHLNEDANNIASLLDEGKINMLKTYLKLQATIIKVNLLQHNQELAASNTNILIANTNLYFKDNPTINRHLTESLEEVKNLNIKPAFVELDDLLFKIDGLYSTVSN